MAIEWQEVDSSNIAAIGYEGTSKELKDYLERGYTELYVRFKSGSVYVYHDVFASVIQDFLDAGSKGKYFHANIKGKYQYEKVS